MIRRTDTFVQQPISTTIDPAEMEKAPVEIENKTPLVLERPVAKYQDGGASQISEFGMQEQATQALLENQFRETAPITKDPSTSRNVPIDGQDVIHRPSRLPGPTPPSPGPAAVQKKNYLSLNDKGPEVKVLQQQLNEWRANQNPPLPPIKESSVYANETELAVQEFQEATGLKKDGAAGGNTKDRLAVENSPNFRKVDPDVQKQIRDKLNQYQSDPDSRANLKQLATDPNFSTLSKTTQENLLTRLASNSGSLDHARKIQIVTKDLASMESSSPDFKNTTPDAKQKAIDRMYQYADNDQIRGNLNKLLSDGKFTKLPIDEQEKFLQIFEKRPDSDMSGDLRRMVSGPAWTQMDAKMKARVFDMLDRNVLDQVYTNNLGFLIGDASFKFDKYSKQDKDKIFNVFENCGLLGRGPLLKFMQRDINGVPAPLAPGRGNTGTALDQLNKLASSPLDSRLVNASNPPKEKVMEDLLSELSNPTQNIDHGDRHTSSVAIMTRDLAEQNPAEYARLVTELSTTGQATLANGDTITPSADAWQEDFSGRSVGERLLQSGLMDYGRPGGGYQNWNPGPDGIPGTKDDGFPNGNIDGFSPDGGGLKLLEGIRVFNGLNGKKQP